MITHCNYCDGPHDSDPDTWCPACQARQKERDRIVAMIQDVEKSYVGVCGNTVSNVLVTLWHEIERMDTGSVHA